MLPDQSTFSTLNSDSSTRKLVRKSLFRFQKLIPPRPYSSTIGYVPVYRDFAQILAVKRNDRD